MDARSQPARAPAGTTPLTVCFGEFTLDEADARLSRAGVQVTLAPKAFAVLCALAREPNRLLTKDALLDTVWGHRFVSESVLKTTISELRAALADDVRQPRYIETVARRGYRFIGMVAAAQAPPARAAAERGRRQPLLIGRQAALAQLQSAWTRAAAGARGVFWITGEAGIGKTTLIDAFAAGIEGAACGRGQCVEQYGAGEPYLPVLDALADLCRSDPRLPPLLRAVAPSWLLQLPWLGGEAEREAVRREIGGAAQPRMLREFGELVDRYSQLQPLLLVTEDLHWSDHATLQLIDHCARRRGPARLLWLASFRLGEVIADEHPLRVLRHELRLHRLCHELPLEPFTERELADYMAARLSGAAVAEALVQTLHGHTDGLPLFVVNVVDDLLAQGRLDGGTGAAAAVPESLAGVIGRQIARLPREHQALLETASVCGTEFRAAAVAAALELEPAAVLRACEALARQQQWLAGAQIEHRADGSLDARFAFRHALYRHVFYERIGALARAQQHRRVAAMLERDRAAGAAVSAAELALHHERGHDLPAALRAYADAAENALRRFAPHEAMELTGRALEQVPACPAGPLRDAFELALAALAGAAAAQRLGVSSNEARQAFARARELLATQPNHPLRGLVLQGLGLTLLVRGEYAECDALGRHMLQLAETDGDAMMLIAACNVLGQVHTLQGRNLEACQLLERGVAACAALGDAALAAAFVVDPGVTMHCIYALPLLHLGRVDQALAQLERAHQRAQRYGEPMATLVVNWFNALFEARRRNAERVAALAENMRAVVERDRLAQGEGPSRWYRGWALALRGEPRAGAQLIRAGFEHNLGLGMLAGAAEVLGYAAEALILAGDWSAAQAEIDAAGKLAAQLGERAFIAPLQLLQARVAHGRGDRRGARQAIGAAVDTARAQQAPWHELAAWIVLHELGLAQARDLDALAAVRARLLAERDDTLAAAADRILAARNSARRAR